MRPLSDRTTHFTDSVIRRMTRIANQYDSVNLSQGFPDFAPPKAITDRLREVAAEGPHQYAITWGAQNFREAVCRKQKHFSGLDYDPNGEIVITCGSTEAMMATMMSVTDPGDKVIIFSPFYENYGADTILSGSEPIYVPLVPLPFRRRRPRSGLPARGQGPRPLQSLQSVRQGLHLRRTHDHRRPGQEIRCLRHHR